MQVGSETAAGASVGAQTSPEPETLPAPSAAFMVGCPSQSTILASWQEASLHCDAAGTLVWSQYHIEQKSVFG